MSSSCVESSRVQSVQCVGSVILPVLASILFGCYSERPAEVLARARTCANNPRIYGTCRYYVRDLLSVPGTVRRLMLLLGNLLESIMGKASCIPWTKAT